MKRRSLCILFAAMLCLLASCVTAMAAETVDGGTCGDNLTWVLDDEGTLTISGAGDMYDYNPEDAPWYDYASEITTVIIEDGITSIGEYAFAFLGITSVSIGSDVASIGMAAFEECESLISVVIPGNVITIGDSAFHGCFCLSDVTIEEGVVTIGQGAFGINYALTTLVIPDSVTTIGERAFYYNTALKNVTIGSGVTRIDSGAFSMNYELGTEIIFTGDAPEFAEDAFSAYTATVYYPVNNSTWTEDVMQQYDGMITWVAYEVEDKENGTASDTSENDASDTGMNKVAGINIWMTLIILSACGFATMGYYKKKEIR